MIEPTSKRRTLAAWLVAAANAAAASPPVAAEPDSIRHPDLQIAQRTVRLADLPPDDGAFAARAAADLAQLGVAPDAAFVDPRGGGWATLLLSEPLLPELGEGATMAGVRPPDTETLATVAWSRLAGWIRSRASALRIDPEELPVELDSRRIAVHDGGALIQIRVPRVVGGVPVRGSYLTAVLGRGNLILFGAARWGPIETPLAPQIDAAEAAARVLAHEPNARLPGTDAAELTLVPLAAGADPARVAPGRGYTYRLAWSLRPHLPGDSEAVHEALIDAHTGEWLAFEPVAALLVAGAPRDEALPLALEGVSPPPLGAEVAEPRAVVGGVFPLSNDGRDPDGDLQAGWPMPFADVVTPDGTVVTDAGGNLPACVAGEIATDLTGPYAAITDLCGAIVESGTSPLLDLDTAAGTDCAVPAGHSAGDTNAARTTFYELNRLGEIARGYLPANAWLQTPVTAAVNIVNSCNALWTGTQLSLYRDLGSSCRNPGELAGVIDALWGQALDDNDVAGTVASPSWASAYGYSTLRNASSCLGRGFFKNQVCTGWGDGCVGDTTNGCTGVEDADYGRKRCNRPHTVSWITGGFTSLQCGGTGSAAPCPASGGTPCGRITNCESVVVAETIWDLAASDLQAPPFNFDANAARALTARLHHLGSGPVGDWYTCAVGGGCAADGGYLNFLAADDDNGNLADGTPHMSAIRAAFERHEIHCAVPATADSGCAGGPTDAPVVLATPGDRAAQLDWDPVAGAGSYRVYRTDGVEACDYGAALVGTTSATAFEDTGLLNGRLYSYFVVPVGTAAACAAKASACASVTPQDDLVDECDPSLIFTDGFESGNTSKWSDAVPGA